MQGREEFIAYVMEMNDELLTALEEREEVDPDFMVSREAAEVLRDELRAL